jgi:hypothetical protein
MLIDEGDGWKTVLYLILPIGLGRVAAFGGVAIARHV